MEFRRVLFPAPLLPGAGYSVRLDAEMWMRDHLAEAYDVVPHGYLDGME